MGLSAHRNFMVRSGPPPPRETVTNWKQTPAWIAPYAKYVAPYPDAFWRKDGLPGQGLRIVGSKIEIYGASHLRGRIAALWGFFSLDAPQTSQLSDDELSTQCRVEHSW